MSGDSLASSSSEESSEVKFSIAPSTRNYLDMVEEQAAEDEDEELKPFAIESASSVAQPESSSLREIKQRMGISLSAAALICLIATSLAFWALQHPYREELSVELSVSINRTLSWMNTSYNACEDPWNYFCGGFLATAQLPPGKIHLAASFSMVQDSVEQRLVDVMEESRHWPYLTTLQQSCLNTSYRAERGMKPATGPLMQILTAKDLVALAAVTANARLSQGLLVQPFFAFSVEIDALSSLPMRHMLNVAPGTLLFSDAAYYAHGGLMANYTEWLKTVFDAAGVPGFDQGRALRLVQLETQLANAKPRATDTPDDFTTNQLHQLSIRLSEAAEAVDDPMVYYNEIEVGELYANCPEGFFKTHLETLLNRTLSGTVNIESPEYLTAACSILSTADFETLKDAVLLSLFARTMPYLGPIQTAAMDQFTLMLYGSDPSLKSPLQRCTEVTQQQLGMLISQYYVDRYFSEDRKDAVKDMVLGLKESFLQELDRFEWMDSQTKTSSELKYSTLIYQIGYPDDWPSTDQLVSRSGGKVFTLERFYENVLSLRKARDTEQLSRLRHPVTPAELHDWLMEPTTVNAYYAAESNSIVFPAAILQEPFYQEDAPDCANWGSIGAVVGHEMAHMTSGSGTYYNAAGQLSDWMSASSKLAWQQRMQCFSEQFSELTYDGIPVNGQKVLGEAVADYWGLKNAYLTMRRLREANYTATLAEETFVREKYDMTPDQLFFASYVQTYCSVSTDEYNELLVRLDEHPLDRFRVERTLANSHEFGEVFACTEGTKFNPAVKCELD